MILTSEENQFQSNFETRCCSNLLRLLRKTRGEKWMGSLERKRTHRRSSTLRTPPERGGGRLIYWFRINLTARKLRSFFIAARHRSNDSVFFCCCTVWTLGPFLSPIFPPQCAEDLIILFRFESWTPYHHTSPASANDFMSLVRHLLSPYPRNNICVLEAVRSAW